MDLRTIPLKREDIAGTEKILIGPQPGTELSRSLGQAIPPGSYTWTIPTDNGITKDELSRAIIKSVDKKTMYLTDHEIWVFLEAEIENRKKRTT